MKRSLLACGLCTAMLGTAVFVFMPSGLAKGLFPSAAPQKENVLEALLDLPAPPPPNPLESVRPRDDAFYDLKNPPPDNAPIEDLIDYWSRNAQNGERRSGYYLLKPSAKVVERLLGEEEQQPGLIQSLLPVLPDDKRTVDQVKSIYDSETSTRQEKQELREWLTMNSPYFADDLERVASRTRDSGGYVSLDREENVLALTKYDWERAKPMLDRMYADNSQPVTKVLATWGLYRHAMGSGDVGDTDRYRSELMHYVEDRSLSPGIRDKANDALMLEPDFSGRDDWAFSLFEDETWVRLPQYTGLTTLISNSPPDKYVSRLTELAAGKNKIVRTAAVRCLITVIDRNRPDENVIRALLPWIGDANWVELDPSDNGRIRVVNYLQSTKMPESVPALIAALDEKATRQLEDYPIDGISNSAANAMNTAAMRIQRMANVTANAANTIATATNSNSNRALKMKEETFYPLREYAVRALGFQADPRAAPALRRLLSSTTIPGYQRTELVAAIMACGGYSVSEQVDALEKFAQKTGEVMAAAETESAVVTNANVGYYNRGYYDGRGIVEGEDLEGSLGMMVASSREPTDELVRATIDRIEKLETKDPLTAYTLKRIITSWKGLAISALLLNDLKTGKAESAAIVRLLSERKSIREKLAAELDDVSKSSPTATGIVACINDDSNSYAAALDNRSTEARVALLACARLVRVELPLSKVAENLRSTDALLKTAAELYLESEDSPEARSLVYSQHPGEAKVLGATVFSKGRKDSPGVSADMGPLFSSVNGAGNWAPYMIYGPGNTGDLQKVEERLRKEVKDETDLMGIYAYQENFVRVYKDRVAFSWEDDPSRYHERNLSADEFNIFKEHLNAHHVGELKPFLACSGGCGPPRELLMLGKNGGSRVYLRSERTPEFFAGLEKIFSRFRAEPSAIKYALGKEVPGLELLFASEQLDAETVWKQGSDLRIVVSNKEVRAKVEDEISVMEADEREEEDDSGDEPSSDAPDIDLPSSTEMISPSQTMRIKREYEGFAWHHIGNGGLGEPAGQPAGVEYIPPRDDLDVQPGDEDWKARTPNIEIRADVTGLYKVVAGKMTKLKAGDYRNAVITPNGRWVIVNKSTDDEGASLVRYNLVTNREYSVTADADGNLLPRCFVPSIGKFLLAAGYYGDEYVDRYDYEDAEQEPRMKRFYTLDPETGAVLPVHGEARPLAGQAFRPLQSTARLNEFWAAMPNRPRGETVVGLYDSRLFKFTPVLKLPKINFNSMDMWVDETENKVYFVYSGHLLRVPLKSTQSM